MTERSIVHATFTVERHFRAAPARVFRAWADPEIKAKWFGAPDEKPAPNRIFEFREGGREYSAGDIPGGPSYTFDVQYYDIVPDNRIIYCYHMTLNGQRISVSVATVDLRPEGAGTHMVVTEMGAYLDGLDTVEQRKAGTVDLLDKLLTLVDAN